MQKLTAEQIENLDPYPFVAELEKRVIHPEGRKSTEEVYQMAKLQSGRNVLDIGCGVGTTAFEIVRKFVSTVMASYIDQNMLHKAEQNVLREGVADKIRVVKADIQQMPFADNEFDVIIAEAVTMFVNSKKAAQEICRVCKAIGSVVEHEFIWRNKPNQEVRRIFESAVCPGIKFDTTEDWLKLFSENRFSNEQHKTGSFVIILVSGFLNDEGIFRTLSLYAKTFSRLAYAKKMMWLMPRIMKVKNSLGYIVFTTTKSIA